jgi:hypothetical protein
MIVLLRCGQTRIHSLKIFGRFLVFDLDEMPGVLLLAISEFRGASDFELLTPPLVTSGGETSPKWRGNLQNSIQVEYAD